MMKKLMTLLLVFAMVSVASATTVTIGIPEGAPGSASNPLRESETAMIIVTSDNGLVGLDAILSVGSGPGSIVGAIGKADAAGYGWDPDLSFDPDVAAASAEIGLGTFGTPPLGDVGYYIVHCDGQEPVVVGLGPGDKFGGSLDKDFAVPDIIGQVTVHQIPEPMTVALLGLGGLALLRRRK
jgi:hypothetical protein